VSESRHTIRGVGAVVVVAALCSACASVGTTAGGTPTPHPFPVPGGNPALPAPPARPAPSGAPGGATEGKQAFDGYALVGTALALRGSPYRNGGSDPHGFDCSGFTQYVYAQYGVTLPRDVATQFKQGKTVKPEAIAPGDLIFFATAGPGASHVAIAVGGDQFVHAPSSSGVVRVERISSGYWAPKFLGARRVG
jgi:cell wall-associated NlpC family hydrolase